MEKGEKKIKTEAFKKICTPKIYDHWRAVETSETEIVFSIQSFNSFFVWFRLPFRLPGVSGRISKSLYKTTGRTEKFSTWQPVVIFLYTENIVWYSLK